jgi:hypothetical protein
MVWFGYGFQCQPCFKNKKINFILAILKLETYFTRIYLYHFIRFHIHIERFGLKQKKSVLVVQKNMPYKERYISQHECLFNYETHFNFYAKFFFKVVKLIILKN